MADKRISQLVDRGTVLNNDVLPIVVSGATTTNKATISSIQTFMQSNLDVGVTSVGITLGSTGTDVNVTGSPVTSSGNITINIPTASATNRGLLSSANWTTFNNKVSSVGLSMPSAFAVANSPITGSGTIAVTGAGTVAQYIRGDGSLADFPQGGGGGGASVNYYLNGSVSQGTIGGVAYLEMNKTPILGAGTDFTIAADGYIASFITDAGDPALLEIPAGNWNFESYFSASSGGGSPSFYIELYKVNSGGTATLIASNSATPELISFGTSISPYFSPLAVPTTVLTVTDRLAVRYYVTHSGRTITLHTENSHLCQIITTFTTGLTALNGLTAQVQNFATGTSGTDFGISSSVSTHTFNLPTASATNRGALSSADWTIFNGKQTALNGTGFVKISGTTISYDNSTYLTTASAGTTYVPYTGAGANVDLGIYNLTANAVNVNASGSSAGVINLESNTIFSLVNGYGTIGSGTTNQFNFYQTTGAGVFRGAILSLNSITASATRTFTLPDADGTLALTTDLGAYLPLAGGTLTGALSGTSAGFSGALTVTSASTTGVVVNSTNNASYHGYRIQNNGTDRALFETNANNGEIKIGSIPGDTNDHFPVIYSDGVAALTFGLGAAPSATFISSVTAGGLVTVNNAGNAVNIIGVVSNPAYYSVDQAVNNSGKRWRFGHTGGAAGFSSFDIYNQTDNILALTLASTGAATFSNNVSIYRNVAATATTLTIENATNNYNSQINFKSIYDGSTAKSFLVGSNINSGGGSWEVYDATESATRMVISSSGNVGIGTASPNGPLDVVVGASGARRLLVNYDDSVVTIKGSAANAQPEVLRLIGDGIRFNSGSSGSGSEIARVTANGITFNGDTAAANALDDYEEGTWTPVLADASTGGNDATGTFLGFYTKIGRLVTLQATCGGITTTGMTGANTLYIRGLPFAIAGSTQLSAGAANFYNVVMGANGSIAWINAAAGTTFIRILKQASGTTNAGLIVSNVTSTTGEISFTIQYYA